MRPDTTRESRRQIFRQSRINSTAPVAVKLEGHLPPRRRLSRVERPDSKLSRLPFVPDNWADHDILSCATEAAELADQCDEVTERPAPPPKDIKSGGSKVGKGTKRPLLNEQAKAS